MLKVYMDAKLAKELEKLESPEDHPVKDEENNRRAWMFKNRTLRKS
jgi:hypothetical protein